MKNKERYLYFSEVNGCMAGELVIYSVAESKLDEFLKYHPLATEINLSQYLDTIAWKNERTIPMITQS